MGVRVMERNEMDMTNETNETYLPQVRCRTNLKQRLQAVAEKSVSQRLTDHIRVAVQHYVEQQERSLGIKQN